MSWDTIEEVIKPIKASFVPSQYQSDIFDKVDQIIDTGGHIVVTAVAGSGKSTTGVEQFNRLPPNINCAFVAFNAPIAKEMALRLPRGANARTYHSLGLATLRNTFHTVNINQDKVDDYLRQIYKLDVWAISAARKLVSLCKGHIKADFTDEDLTRIAFSHDVELYNDSAQEKIFRAVHAALEYSMQNPNEVDFDDMIWLPNVLEHVAFSQFDFLFIDEVQDTNLGQLYLAMNSIAENGNIVGVGDEKQSIYAFRGADSTAMARLTRELNAYQMPLSLSYRCSKATRDYVNKEFPDIKFEVPDNAVDGVIESVMMSDKLLESIQPDDMVLCRVNADLVSLAFKFIRAGRKASIQGRNIGDGIVGLIKRSKEESVVGLLGWLQSWKVQETNKAYSLGMERKIQYITDRYETLIALSDGAKDVAEIVSTCHNLFANSVSGIRLSSLHKSKGLEADNVFILRPDLLPHPMAKKPEDLVQEDNLRYVGVTRNRKSLTFIQ